MFTIAGRIMGSFFLTCIVLPPPLRWPEPRCSVAVLRRNGGSGPLWLVPDLWWKHWPFTVKCGVNHESFIDVLIRLRVIVMKEFCHVFSASVEMVIMSFVLDSIDICYIN